MRTRIAHLGFTRRCSARVGGQKVGVEVFQAICRLGAIRSGMNGNGDKIFHLRKRTPAPFILLESHTKHC